MSSDDHMSWLALRLSVLSQWLEEVAPYVSHDQKHLDDGTLEQAYWHLGYCTALRDAIKAITPDNAGSTGKSNRSPSDDPDA